MVLVTSVMDSFVTNSRGKLHGDAQPLILRKRQAILALTYAVALDKSRNCSISVSPAVKYE